MPPDEPSATAEAGSTHRRASGAHEAPRHHLRHHATHRAGAAAARSVRRARVPAAGLLPSLFLAGVLIGAPFAGTTTGAVAHATPAHSAATSTTHARSSGAKLTTKAGTTTAAGAAAAGKSAVGKAAVATKDVAVLPLKFSRSAAAFATKVYLGTAGIALLVVLFALVWLSGGQRRADRREAKAAIRWTDAFTTMPSRPLARGPFVRPLTRGRSDRSPEPAVRV